MEHSIFVAKYKTKQIAVDIDRNKAGFMYGQKSLMPDYILARQTKTRTVAFGGIIVTVALFFFAPWWIAVGVMLVVFFMFLQIPKSAAKGVLEASLQSPQVYELAVQNHILNIREL